MRHVSCILLLEWSTTSQRLWVYRFSVPYAQTYPRFLFEKRRGQPQEFWSLVSTIDGSTLPQYCVEESSGSCNNSVKPMFHQNANAFALGLRVGGCTKGEGFALPLPTCWYPKASRTQHEPLWSHHELILTQCKLSHTQCNPPRPNAPTQAN